MLINLHKRRIEIFVIKFLYMTSEFFVSLSPDLENEFRKIKLEILFERTDLRSSFTFGEKNTSDKEIELLKKSSRVIMLARIN